MFTADGVGGQLWPAISSAVLLAIGACEGECQSAKLPFGPLIPTASMATVESVVSTHDCGFGVTDPLDVDYNTAAYMIHGMPRTVLRESDAIVRRQPALSDKRSQGFLIDGAISSPVVYPHVVSLGSHSRRTPLVRIQRRSRSTLRAITHTARAFSHAWYLCPPSTSHKTADNIRRML